MKNPSACLIITAFVDAIDRLRIDPAEYGCIICADGGLVAAEKLGLTPDILIGDYDSCPQPKDREVIKLPAEKDVTDSEAAIQLAYEKGWQDITLLGGLGGRFDHTMGNLGMLAKYTGKLRRIRILDGNNRVFVADPSDFTVHKDGYKYLGLAAYDSPVTGLTLTGMKYPLRDAVLDNRTTLGGSNEILGETGQISFRSGRLLVVQCNDAR